MSEKYKVKYSDGLVEIRQFKVVEATRYAKLSQLLRNPIKREEVQFGLIVDTFRDTIKSDIPVEEMDLMAFRELCTMVSGYSSKDSSTPYSFKCDNQKMENIAKETKKDLYKAIKKKDGGSDEESVELKEIKEEYEKLPDYVPCNHTIKGSIPFDKLKADILYLKGREVISKNNISVYSYTVSHRLLLDRLEYQYSNKMVTLKNMAIDEEINSIDTVKIKDECDNQKIVFDFVKIALHLIPMEELSESNVWEKYNFLHDLTIERFKPITDKIKEELDFKAQLIRVVCPNCEQKYDILMNIEDFRLIPI